jgi:4-hydroxy-3-methylbut-2-enyl diphosphate reductase
MEVIRAKVLGFCMGVRRAVELAMTEPCGSERVFSYGQLVHNPKVLADLRRRGIETIDRLPQNLEGCCVIIRAHGISPAAEKDLRERGARIVDATCPNVKSCQLKARQRAKAGYCLFLAGEAKHAEIEGILGYAHEAAFCKVINTAEDAEKNAKKLFDENKSAKTVLLGQTTISQEEYNRIGETIKKFFPDLEIESTICSATRERQDSLRELLGQVDAVIIAGGKESSNTRRLLAIAERSGKPCALVEDADEIPETFFSYDKVGLSAGASTPDSVIDEIERKCTVIDLLNAVCQ